MTEEGFREMLTDPARYSAWAAKVRLAWEHENVVWLHGFAGGKPVWKRERPPPEVAVDPEKTAGPRFQRTRVT